MSHWCATNYRIRGDKAELEAIAKSFNDLKTREQNITNGFGPLWMGNWMESLGIDYNTVSCRGLFVQNPDCGAGAGNPVSNLEEEFKVENGVLKFSTVTANWPSKDFENILMERWPSISIKFMAADEDDYFHYTNETLLDNDDFYLYYLSDGDGWEKFRLKDRQLFIKSFQKMCPDLNIPDDITDKEMNSKAFVEKFRAWLDADEAREYCAYVVYDFARS